MEIKPFTDFLENVPKVKIPGAGLTPFNDSNVILAGVVPFCRINGEWMVYLAKPVAAKPDLPPPKFQIGKGTRMMRSNGKWRDCKNPDLPLDIATAEPLAVTALREAQEELGLVLDNISRMVDTGTQIMYSTTGGHAKAIALYFAEINDATRFVATSIERASTAARGWFNPWKSADEIRDDHRMLIQHWLPRAVG